MTIKPYNVVNAVSYAKKWALARNPKYYNFDKLGGDCTNFVSQCLFAGCNVMNFTKNNPWYYNSLNDRSPSWTGVEFLYKFLISNKLNGPFGNIVSKEHIALGDIIQLGNNERFYHTLIVTKIFQNNLYTSSHTIDSLDRPLESYRFERIRYIKIKGIRT